MSTCYVRQLSMGYIVDTVDEINTLALTRPCWLHDPIFSAFVTLHFFRELAVLLRQDEGFWDKWEMPLAVDALHAR